MKLSSLSFFTLLTSTVTAANSFAGTNLYYAAGLSASQRSEYFAALQKAGMKVLRVWLDGQSTATTKARDRNTPITSWPDLETTAVGTYNDTVLSLLDTVMLDARKYDIKLIISLHSWNALSRPDIYGQWYGTGDFYTEADAIAGFDNRLRHVLNHVHTKLGKPWKDLSEYIFGFEAENEAMIGNGQEYIVAHSDWQCARAQTIKNELGSSRILVMTGGESWMDESVNDVLLTCEYLDVISIHAYGVGDFATTSIQNYVDRAVKSQKKLLFQEWGACYYNTTNNRCDPGAALPNVQRDKNIALWAHNISAAGVPWLYWQVLPNADPHYDWDYEVGIQDPSWPALALSAASTLPYKTPFDYSEYLT